MKFITHNERDIGIAGSSFQGSLRASYEELVKVLGEPEGVFDGKVSVQWKLEFDDGTVIAIYDWKISGSAQDNYHWNVGGYNRDAILYANEVLLNLAKRELDSSKLYRFRD